MKQENSMEQLKGQYPIFKNPNLNRRYITFEHLEPEIRKLSTEFKVEEIGRSVLKNPIHSVTFGSGSKKVLAWSQMHGNETTTTKAIFDLFNLFGNPEIGADISQILAACTIKIIPMLNPDGAARYTRANVNAVDLNRDAQNLHEPESRVLRECFDDFKPHFCLNLHDQRTIFSAGDEEKPASLSFLAPALDEERTIPESRKKAMQLIVAMNQELQKILPGQIGRYDDGFNLNCAGDTFQALKVPTILFEAGHFQNDYSREETRKFMAFAIFLSFLNISNENYSKNVAEDYFKIPENKKKFYDVIIRNVEIERKIADVAFQFEEKIKAGKIDFRPVVKLIAPEMEFYGHREINAEGGKISTLTGKTICENDIVNQILLNSKRLTIKR